MVKRIGLMTNGGDCAGLNAVIRAVALHGTQNYGWEVVGIFQKADGVQQVPFHTIDLNAATLPLNMLRLGGTFLGGVIRSPPPGQSSMTQAEMLVKGYHDLGLDALIVTGGDGSLSISQKIAQEGGINLVAIPKTIDNDLYITNVSVGFSTAVSVATEAIDRLRPTASSHHRVMIMEVMGRDAGHIALESGLAGGADMILIPEIPYKLDHVMERVKALKAQGQNSILIVVAEGVKTQDGEHVMVSYGEDQKRYGGVAHYLADQITERTGFESRFTVLGHTQRGAEPTARDRILGSALGVAAVDLVAQGVFDHVVAWKDEEIVSIPLSEALKENHGVDPQGMIMSTARALGISFGDGKIASKV